MDIPVKTFLTIQNVNGPFLMQTTDLFCPLFPSNAMTMCDAGWLTGTDFHLELNVQCLLVQPVLLYSMRLTTEVCCYETYRIQREGF